MQYSLRGRHYRYDQSEEDEKDWHYAALMAAAYLGRIDDMRHLNIPDTLSVNQRDAEKWLYPPILAVALNGQEEAVRFLIDLGADASSASTLEGHTSLHFAACSGNVSLVQYLVDIGLNVNQVSDDDDSPLAWAAGTGYTVVVRALVAKGAIPGDYRPLGWASNDLRCQERLQRSC
ncbi:ankyrin repeat-containing domain protein [Aspergillus heterothallicus]